MSKSLVLYLAVLLVFVTGVYIALDQGYKLNAPQTVALDNSTPNSAAEPSPSLLDNLKQNLDAPLTRLFIQIILIVLVAGDHVGEAGDSRDGAR